MSRAAPVFLCSYGKIPLYCSLKKKGLIIQGVLENREAGCPGFKNAITLLEIPEQDQNRIVRLKCPGMNARGFVSGDDS